MKKIILSTILLALVIASCEEETKPVDPIHEFIAFKGPASLNVNELTNSETAVPVEVEIKAFVPYSEDIHVTFEITGNNAVENTDFTVSPSGSVKIPAGSFVSEPILIKTIDNDAGTPVPRSFDMRITSVSKENVKIGLGITEPKNEVITVNILDDECSETISIFNSGSLVNTLDWGGGPVDKPVKGVVTGNDVKVTGDLIDYGPFANASITITLTAESEGATKGTATFGEQLAGTDSDGYEYKFTQTGEGTYDVCNGVINIAYDIYYMDGGWVYWYSVSNAISVP
ncbi:MAG TPA: hypothetical protein VFO54_01155 [Chryseosolibacter sp.]|nr:hypothetical protein [Chryseosolibacter sp.]